MVLGTSVAQGIGYAARLTILKIQPGQRVGRIHAGATPEERKNSLAVNLFRRPRIPLSAAIHLIVFLFLDFFFVERIL
jgi:hypothetical protein